MEGTRGKYNETNKLENQIFSIKLIKTMIINSTLKYIFMDVPKTGTTSIQKWLIENDKNAKKRIYTDRNIDCTHIRYKTLEEVLGEDLFKYKVIAVVRHPYERVVSAYYFYKKGGKKKLIKNYTKTSLGVTIKIIIAKILPFWLWALVYPLKKTKYFINSKNDTMLVDYLIDYSNLNETIPKIMEEIGLNISTSIPVINVTNNKKKTLNYTKIEEFILKLKYGKELRQIDLFSLIY
jgi:hypothetical protein